jgi:hypothetical protein
MFLEANPAKQKRFQKQNDRTFCLHFVNACPEHLKYLQKEKGIRMELSSYVDLRSMRTIRGEGRRRRLCKGGVLLLPRRE